MSGMVGIWNVDGQPVDREVLAAMSARMAHRGPDGESIWINNHVGFAFQMMKVAPESAHESQPLHSSGVTLVYDGRLDNREELLSRLPNSAGVSSQSPDPELVMAAYRHFGRDFARHFVGDIAVALWDSSQRRMFLARDIMAGRTLYHCRRGNTFLFATEIKALLAHPLVEAKPNDYALAEYFYRNFDYRDPSKTFFEGISNVRPAHVLSASPEGERAERFWDFNPAKRVRCKDHRDYAAGYKEHFLAAVKRRMRSSFPVASMVSGGLDSSSIFCSALTLKAQSPATLPDCFGIAGVPASTEANELEYQLAVEKMYGVRLRQVPVRNYQTLTDPQTDVYHSEAPFIHWHDWKQIWEQSRNQGARVLMSGFFGDHLLILPQFYVDLAMSFRWLTLKRHIDAYRRYYDFVSNRDLLREAWSGIKGYAVPPSVRPFYHALKRRFRRPFVPLACFSSRFSSVAEQLEREARPLRFPAGSAHARTLYHFAHSTHSNARVALESLWESKYQIQTAYPFRDQDLIAYLMAIPGEEVFSGGIPRGIHREAMRGILPEEIRTRRTKATFSGLSREASLADLKIFRQNLADSSALRLGYLKPIEELSKDLQGFQDWLQQDDTAVSSWETSDVIFLDVWLSVFFPER